MGRPGFIVKLLVLAIAGYSLSASAAWNNPYPVEERDNNIVYSSFRERPKHLDPARSYSSDEYRFIAQIYEPPLQYHFLKRPYQLIPLTLARMPEVRYLDAQGNELPASAEAGEIATSVYEFKIRPGTRYQPHPALAGDSEGSYLYHSLSAEQVRAIHTLSDFEQTGTRELLAEDYVYQIKRLADPKFHSPIAGVMAQYIIGFEGLMQTLQEQRAEDPKRHIDLRSLPLEGVEVVDSHTYRIRINGKYPQFLYWQAMPFFAPMPWEADLFYSQPGMEENNVVLDWYPIGTGAFMLGENNPNLRMTLLRNPNFRGESYPSEGEPGDREVGLLDDAGEPLPFIEKAVYTLEKETIPTWTKFLQGYYDNSGISSDSFDQAIQIDAQGNALLTSEMEERDIRLATAVQTSSWYIGFNMLDEVLGRMDESGRKLRTAISIAVDIEEFVSIFLNGRGIPAQGPVPPGIFGAREGEAGINPHVYEWVDGKPRKRSIDEARRLLAEAGYANGIDQETGKPLTLHFEAIARGPGDKAEFDWWRKQFQKLNIQLVVRPTDYNRFREKMLKGNAQIYMWGWNADYPDPENFLFLLHGPNSKALHNGENTSNYDNPRFNELFEQMKNMDNGPQRQAIIDEMVEIAQTDAPWIWGFHPKSFALYHDWYHNVKPNLMANNTLKYKRIEPDKREQLRDKWNQPVLWPLAAVFVVMVGGIVPAVITFRRRERSTAV